MKQEQERRERLLRQKASEEKERDERLNVHHTEKQRLQIDLVIRQSALHHMSYDMEEQKREERIKKEHETGRRFLEEMMRKERKPQTYAMEDFYDADNYSYTKLTQTPHRVKIETKRKEEASMKQEQDLLARAMQYQKEPVRIFD